jgi:hypothetical protein
METTKNEMPSYAKIFYNKLSNYLDTKIYFYGSIQRPDYSPKYSDIDADIFTDNEMSTISQIANFLEIKKNDFKKFIYNLHKTNKVVYGYKIKYKDPENNFSTEISVYNEKDKDGVLIEHGSKLNIPFYITFFLIILKFFYYNLGLLPKKIYKDIKNWLMNYLIEGKDSEFIVIEIPSEEELLEKNK